MNFQQLRFVREAARHGFNLTEVGHALHTTQSGVSKCIRELEMEVGVEIFERHGRRIVGWTPAGAALAAIAERILDEADAFRQCALAHRTGAMRLDGTSARRAARAVYRNGELIPAIVSARLLGAV